MKRRRAIFIFLAMGSVAFYGCKKSAINEELASSQNISAKATTSAANSSGVVYIQSNQASGNEVLVYTRSSTGSLSPGSSFASYLHSLQTSNYFHQARAK